MPQVRRALIGVALVSTLGLAGLSVTTSAVVAKSSPARSARAHHRCHGHRATITGNRHKNTIVGTRHRDIIWAGAGRDRVLGRGGNDLICGGKGADALDGMSGLDADYGGGGKDWCVAWRHKEHHRYHHNCEVHVQVHRPRHKPGRNAPMISAQRVTGSAPSAQQAGGVCGPECNAGRPGCNQGLVTYDGTGATFPSVYLQDGGYIAIGWQVWENNRDGTFSLEAFSDWWTTEFLAGGQTWSIIPTPIKFDSRDGIRFQAASVTVVWFSYSRDAVNWSTPEKAIATGYDAFISGDDLGGPAGMCVT